MAGRDTFNQRFAASVVLLILTATQVVESHILFNPCSHTPYPLLCQPIVRRISTAKKATHVTIQALEEKTKLAIADAARFKAGNQAITTCFETMNDAMFNLANAKKSLRGRDVGAINADLTAVVSDYGTCVEGFIDTMQVNTVQNIAVDLRKIGSNCLALSTLIH